jgi:hypothetical protein
VAAAGSEERAGAGGWGHAVSGEIGREIAIFGQLSEKELFPAALIEFAQNQVVLLTTKSEAHTKFFRQPHFRHLVPVEPAIQEQVKRAIRFLDYFENPVLFRVFPGLAHETPLTELFAGEPVKSNYSLQPFSGQTIS